MVAVDSATARTTSGQDADDSAARLATWKAQRQQALGHTLRSLILRLRGPATPETQGQPNASVSYLRQSASQQLSTAPGTLLLPHVTFRPPGLVDIGGEQAGAGAEKILSEEVPAVLFGALDEATQKEYLLLPAERASIIAENSGTVFSAAGAAALADRLSDRSFAVLHYTLAADGSLQPCKAVTSCAPADTAVRAEQQPATADADDDTFMAASTVQLGISCKKGVGGTYPARCAARRLQRSGVLPGLLLEEPPTAGDVMCSRYKGEADGTAREVHGCLDSMLAEVERRMTPPRAKAAGAASGDAHAAMNSMAADRAMEADAPADMDEAPALATAGTENSGDSSAPLCRAAAEQPAAEGHPRLKLYTRSCRLELYVQTDVWEALRSTHRNALYTIVRILELRLAALFAAHSRAQLLGFCERLEAAMDAEPPCSSRPGSSQTGAVTPLPEALAVPAVAVSAVAQPAAPPIPQLRPAPSSNAVWGPQTPRRGGSDTRSAVQATAAQAADSTPTASATATEPAMPEPSIPTGHKSSTVQPVQAAEPQTAQQDEPPAPWTPQKVASVRPAAAPSPRTPLCQSGSQLEPTPPCTPWRSSVTAGSSCEGAAAGSSAAAATCAAAAACAAQLLQPADNSAEAVSEAEALALAAACVAAASPPKRAAVGRFPWPLYFIATRDCFTFELAARSSHEQVAGGTGYMKTQYYFRQGEVPDNYFEVMGKAPAEIATGPLPVGVTTYTQVYDEQQLAAIEAGADAVMAKAAAGALPPECVCQSHGRGGNLRRTKFFFGARYLWTQEQLHEAGALRAAGVRVDVPPVPPWVQRRVEAPLVERRLVPAGFVNSAALNLYHDGSEGIQSHFDDATRFERPVVSLRLFSDSRLSFGTQLYGYGNGSFCIDMPRGCVLVMDTGGYAVTGVKHCVRPMDMTGKSAGLILRRIRPTVLEEAQAIQMERLTAAAERWSLRHSEVAVPVPPVVLPPPDRVAPKRAAWRHVDAKHNLAVQCRSVLNDCIAALEARLPADDRVAADVADVLDGIMKRVAERQQEASAAAQGPVQPQHRRRCTSPRVTAAASRGSHPVCFACERGGTHAGKQVAEPVSANALWVCAGPCHRSFHRSCQQPTQANLCIACASHSWTCSGCGLGGSECEPLVRCSAVHCGRCYHARCLAAPAPTQPAATATARRTPAGSGHPAAGTSLATLSGPTAADSVRPAVAAAGLRKPAAGPQAGGRADGTAAPGHCPAHACCGCGAGGRGVRLVHCIRCPVAWCARCKPTDARLLSRRLARCGHHSLLPSAATVREQRQPPAAVLTEPRRAPPPLPQRLSPEGVVPCAISSMQPADPQPQPLRQPLGVQPDPRPSMPAASSLCQGARCGAVSTQQLVASPFRQAVTPWRAPGGRGGVASAAAASAAAPYAAGTALRSDAAVGMRKRMAPPSLLPPPGRAHESSVAQRRLAEAAMPPRKVLKYDWTQERR